MPEKIDAISRPLLTQSQQVRLELLQLAYRHDRSPEDAIQRAKALEAYVSEQSAGDESVVGRQGHDEPRSDGDNSPPRGRGRRRRGPETASHLET